MTQPSPDAGAAWMDPPIDSAELCARLRFSLDEPIKLSKESRVTYCTEVAKIREHIQGSCVRVSSSLLPGILGMAELVAERLMMPRAPQLYVKANPNLNAGVYLDEESPVIVLHSALVELLSIDELAAVIGHEYGHAILRHYRDMSSAGHVLGLERIRAQEVSADRVGLVGAGSLELALRAEVKIASGLNDRHLSFDLDALLKDVNSTVYKAGERVLEAGSTHPEFPFRFWALAKFAASNGVASTMGATSGRLIADVEMEIEDRFQAIGGGEAFRATSDLVHEAVAWLGVLIVAEDDAVTPTERDVLVQLVGSIWADDATEYARRHGLDSVRRRAAEVIEQLAHAGSRTQMRIEKAIEEFSHRTGATVRCREMLEFARSCMTTIHPDR